MLGAKYGRNDVVQTLLGKQADYNSVSINGSTALSVAAEHAGVDTLTLLVNYGANLDTVDNDGDALIACAILGGNKENAEYLLSLGAPLGETALA